MKFFLILFLVYIQKNQFSILNENSNTLNKIKNGYKYNGFDHRYKYINKTEEQEKLYNIHKHFENKKLLDILQNENISLITKLLLLQDNRIKPHNIFAGGLTKDFDFEI
jgi:hypothetical protein